MKSNQKFYLPHLFTAIVLLLALMQARAQDGTAKQVLRDDSALRWGVSTNIADWASLAVANISVQRAVSRRVSLTLDAKYNAVSWRKGGKEIEPMNRQQTYALGMRWWPWYVYSGWWVAAKAQYQEYHNATGVFSYGDYNECGDAFGAGLAGGYTLMLNKHFNAEFGIGLWGGVTDYDRYENIYAPGFSKCAHIGPHIGGGRRGFVRPNDISISIMYIF